MENCRLLMCICSKEPMTCDILMVYLMRLLRFHLYIYGVEPPKFMKLLMDSSSVTQKPLFTIVISSLTPIRRLVKVERLWREAFRGLYGYLSLVDIVCLKMMAALTHQVSWARGLTTPTSPFKGSLLGLAQVGLRSLTRGLIMQLAFF